MWNYYRDERNDFPANNYNADPITSFESFKYKSSIAGKTSNANQEDGEKNEQENTKTKKNIEIVVPLNDLSNLWRSLDIPLINCEVSLKFFWSEKYGLKIMVWEYGLKVWSENYVLTDITTRSKKY